MLALFSKFGLEFKLYFIKVTMVRHNLSTVIEDCEAGFVLLSPWRRTSKIANDNCQPMQNVCDGIIDCRDGWDESPHLCIGKHLAAASSSQYYKFEPAKKIYIFFFLILK